MLLRITEGDKVLSLKIEMTGSVANVVMPTEEFVGRKLVTNDTVTGIGAKVITDENGEIVDCIGIVSDPLYLNSSMVLYSRALKRLFMVPNVLHFMDLFVNITVNVKALTLGINSLRRNDAVSTWSLSHLHTDLGTIELDVTKLNTITLAIHSFNIPGVVGDGDLNKATYLKHGSNDTVNYENSHISIGVEINIPDDVILSKSVNVGVMYPTGFKNNRYETYSILKENLINFKKVYFII